MSSAQRNSSDAVDHLINGFDRALKTLTGGRTVQRENPAEQIQDADLSDAEKRHVGGLMRVNHTGEICAQALYEGQAMTARDPVAQRSLLDAAAEEQDHLTWCAQRLEELDARPSVLDPLFYGASFVLGAGAGLLGDRISLGFVEATEAQVVEHLNEHLDSIPQSTGFRLSRRFAKNNNNNISEYGFLLTEALCDAGPGRFTYLLTSLINYVTFNFP